MRATARPSAPLVRTSKPAIRQLVAFVGSSLFLLAPPAGAGGPDGPHFFHGKAPEVMMEHRLEALGLEPEQMERVREILASSREARETNREEMGEAFRRMHDLLEAESPDEAAVMEQAERMGELRTEEHKAMLRTLLAVRAGLTPEQREKLKEMWPPRGKFLWREKSRLRHGPAE